MAWRASFKPFQNTHYLAEHYRDIISFLQAETTFRLFDSWLEVKESRLC